MHDGVAGVAGGEQHLQPGPAPQRLVGELAAVHAAGHHHVGEQQVDRRRRVEQRRARPRRCGASARDSRARSGSRRCRRAARRRPRPPGCVSRADRARGAAAAARLPTVGASCAAMARQVDLHRRAFADLAVDPHMAGRLPHEAVDLAQAEPGALADLLGGEERLEGALQRRLRPCRRRCRRPRSSRIGPARPARRAPPT